MYFATKTQHMQHFKSKILCLVTLDDLALKCFTNNLGGYLESSDIIHADSLAYFHETHLFCSEMTNTNNHKTLTFGFTCDVISDISLKLWSFFSWKSLCSTMDKLFAYLFSQSFAFMIFRCYLLHRFPISYYIFRIRGTFREMQIIWFKNAWMYQVCQFLLLLSRCVMFSLLGDAVIR